MIGRGLDTETIRSIENTLVYCYVSSVMGRRSIPPSIISHVELLSDPEIGLIYVSKCRDDPFSDHEAKTCRVKLARLTDAGLSVAKEIHLGTLDRRVAEVKEALSGLPEREMGLVKYFIGKRVLSEEDLYGWDLTVPHFHVASKGYFPPCFRSQSEERTILPAEVHESINIVKEKISSLVLATPSWRHTVSGFAEDILAVCPETLQMLSKEMGSYELDSYLWSCQRFIQFLEAKLDLLLQLTPYGDGYGGMITNRDVRSFAEGFGIPEPVILDWLRDLHDEFPELISEIDGEAMESTEDVTVCHIAEGDRYELGFTFTIISYPKLVEMLKAETLEEAYLEVLENVKEWFATGEKRPFTAYLKIERSLRHPLNFSSCTHVKDRAETEKMYKG